MIDFLKSVPGVTKDEYLWSYSVPQIELSLYDQTRVEYLTEEQAKIEKARRNARYVDSESLLSSDLGIPIL